MNFKNRNFVKRIKDYTKKDKVILLAVFGREFCSRTNEFNDLLLR